MNRAPGGKIRRLFIANRGEICRRIATTAKRLGIEVVAITDRPTPAAFLMGLIDTFIHVASETTAVYLDGALMVRYAKEYGCDAVHPGFGFLSENAGFAQGVIDAGLIWVGPSPSSIQAMASKAGARLIALENSFPCIDALEGFVVDDEVAATNKVCAFGKKVGYPLLVKAALGGGGKGMRLVSKDDEVREALVRASSEALKSFGDRNLVVEKYLGAPRHVEVQVLGDTHGQVFAIGDRDCSVQRRHQKVLEEAPAPCLTDATRRAIQDCAVKLAKAVKYFSAGTVELLVDGAAKPAGDGLQAFYFLEMNTRLQVEHPVTEEVFGLDLVEWQLRIAMGERLPPTFAHLQPKGHSIEARVYAEDASKGFLPNPGMLYDLKPDLGTGIRWEIGLDVIDEVTANFDPMIAKVIATGPDRNAALDRLATTLERTFLCAPASNVPLVIATARDSIFRAGGVTTHYLKDRASYLDSSMTAHRKVALSVAEAVYLALKSRAAGAGGASGPTIAAVTAQAFSARAPRLNVGDDAGFRWGAETHASLKNETVQVRNGWGYWSAGRGEVGVSKVQGFHYAIVRNPDELGWWVGVSGEVFKWIESRESSFAGTSAGGSVAVDVEAPLPGKVISVNTVSGQKVEAGQQLFVMESMKMELEVKAAKAGTIDKVLVTSGQTVLQGALLATWASS